MLDAARRHFEERGFHGASLEEIAEDAGFSKGAVYSRFASKDDVFLAVLEDHIERRAAATRAELDALVDDDIVAIAKHSLRTSIATVAWQAALLEFRAHAWRTAEVNARYLALHRRTIDSIAEFIAEAYRRRGEDPPMPVRLMAVGGLAESTGVLAEFMADADIDVEALIEATVAGLTRPLVREEP